MESCVRTCQSLRLDLSLAQAGIVRSRRANEILRQAENRSAHRAPKSTDDKKASESLEWVLSMAGDQCQQSPGMAFYTPGTA